MFAMQQILNYRLEVHQFLNLVEKIDLCTCEHTDLKEITCEGVEWMHLAQDRV